MNNRILINRSGSALPAFLIVIAVSLAVGFAAVNMWNLNRRVGMLEAQIRAMTRGADEPDPNMVHEVDTAGAPSKGREAAPVTIVEFAEFQCPFCMRVGPTLKQIEETYGDKVRFVWKHLPLTSIHANAMNAALASEAARAQGKFWEYHDMLFANQANLAIDDLKRYAKDVGLDVARFEKDMVDPQYKKRVETDIAEAANLKVSGTPGFFINGRFVSGAQPFATFAQFIDDELAKVNNTPPAKRSS